MSDTGNESVDSDVGALAARLRPVSEALKVIEAVDEGPVRILRDTYDIAEEAIALLRRAGAASPAAPEKLLRERLPRAAAALDRLRDECERDFGASPAAPEGAAVEWSQDGKFYRHNEHEAWRRAAPPAQTPAEGLAAIAQDLAARQTTLGPEINTALARAGSKLYDDGGAPHTPAAGARYTLGSGKGTNHSTVFPHRLMQDGRFVSLVGDRLAEEIVAALNASPPPTAQPAAPRAEHMAAPAGWRLVLTQLTPTVARILLAMDADEPISDRQIATAQVMWDAMLAASPLPAAAPPDSGQRSPLSSEPTTLSVGSSGAEPKDEAKP